MSEGNESLIPALRRISVVAYIDIAVEVEIDGEDAELLVESGIAAQAVQDAIGHTGATVGFVERWSFDD